MEQALDSLKKGRTLKHIVQAPLFVLLLLVSFGPAQAQLKRPTPMGVQGSNDVTNTNANISMCFSQLGTLGAVVADQNGTQYVLSAAHVLALGASSFLATGSNEPIEPPDLITAAGGFCNNITPALKTKIEIGTLSTVVPVSFTGGISQADAAIAQVLPGQVSPSIVKIPTFSGVQLVTVKKGLQLQMTGAASGKMMGHVHELNVSVTLPTCQFVPTALNETKKTCGLANVNYNGSIVVKPGNFAKPGDSGALVLTAGSCPQPVGVVIGGNTKTGIVFVEPIGSTMKALISAGGYQTLSVVSGGAGCTPTTSQVQDFGDDNPADFTLQDATVPDPDVAQALAVLPNVGFGFLCAGNVAGVAIDLSVSPAALDVEVYSSADLDPYNICIPSSFGGVPVEQSVMPTGDNGDDTTDLAVGSYSN